MVKCYTKNRKDGSKYITCNKDIKGNKPAPKKPAPKKPAPKKPAPPPVDTNLFLEVSKVLTEVEKRNARYQIIKKKVLLGDIGTKKGQFIINKDYGTIGTPSPSGRYFKTVAEFIKAEKKELKDFSKKNPKSLLILDKKLNKYSITTMEQIKKHYDPDKELKVYTYYK